MQWDTRQSQPIFRPTNHRSVMPANRRPCLLTLWQSLCHQVWLFSSISCPPGQSLPDIRPVNLLNVTPGACLTKTYDITIQRYCKSQLNINVIKMHILLVYGFKILCEISKVPFEISHKILNPFTTKLKLWGVKSLVNYDILRVMIA